VFGTTPGQRQLVITAPTHPIAAGLAGTVTVCPAGGTFAWGQPSPAAVVVARLVGPGPPAILAYEKGTAMAGLTAPARRVGFFFENPTATALAPHGWRLFDAAVRWTAGR
jgi:hypothetical protein